MSKGCNNCDENSTQLCFKRIGLSDEKAKETLRNAALSTCIYNLLTEVDRVLGPNAPLDRSAGVLIYSLATKFKKLLEPYTPLLVEYICNQKIVNEQQLMGALNYLTTDAVKTHFDKATFEERSGVGQVVTTEDIRKAVNEIVQSRTEEIKEKGYGCFSAIMSDVKRRLLWADGKIVKDEVENALNNLIGSRIHFKQTKKPKEMKKECKAAADVEIIVCPDGSIQVPFNFSSLSYFHKPGENYKTDGYIVGPNTMKLLEEHLRRTGGKVITRFPPEPNGILHVGHAKSINLNFGYAKEHNGITYLRFDDTNPEKEEQRFFEGIIDVVEWLGYHPYKITYASDYFERMYDLARQLISKDLAYVCHQNPEELKGYGTSPSPWRSRPIQESLKLFQDMRDGLFDEGAATLRMKIIMEDGKQDPVAYRIKYSEHARTGDKWCIYPTYDYTHCLNDSFEDITHSMCTKEFQSRRSSYYWLCNALDLYCPVQWEFGRLNLYYTVVSKRKITKLIENKIVSDWDDPRLFTLAGLRRRGFPPQAINLFCAKIGITTAQTTLHPDLLDACARDVLNITAKRAMVVTKPLLVQIVNWKTKGELSIMAPDFPQDQDRGRHQLCMGASLYIDQSDFMESHDESYKRFSPIQPVGLRHSGYVLTWKECIKRSDGSLEKLLVEANEISASNKPKAFIQWVCSEHCTPAEIRFYSRLFKHETPEDLNVVPGGFLSDINKDSLVVERGALTDISISMDVKPFTTFQFERMGYFCVDPDSPIGCVENKKKVVFNLTVALRDDYAKGQEPASK